MRVRGWHRWAVALSLAWPLLASLLYFSQVGVILTPSERFPSWVYAWDRATFGNFNLTVPFGLPFGIEMSAACAGCYSASFNGIGYANFLVIPVLFIWLAGYYAAWVRKTFIGTALVPKGTWGRVAAAAYLVALHGVLFMGIYGREEREIGFVIGFLLLFLSFPVGYVILEATRFLSGVGAIPQSTVAGIVALLAVVAAGYIQWFVAVPWLYRKLRALSGRESR